MVPELPYVSNTSFFTKCPSVTLSASIKPVMADRRSEFRLASFHGFKAQCVPHAAHGAALAELDLAQAPRSLLKKPGSVLPGQGVGRVRRPL